jgi:hypothetical protein
MRLANPGAWTQLSQGVSRDERPDLGRRRICVGTQRANDGPQPVIVREEIEVLDGPSARLGVHELQRTELMELSDMMADVPERMLKPLRKLDRTRWFVCIRDFQDHGSRTGCASAEAASQASSTTLTARPSCRAPPSADPAAGSNPPGRTRPACDREQPMSAAAATVPSRSRADRSPGHDWWTYAQHKCPRTTT